MRSTLTVRLDEDLAEALRRESRQSGVSRGEIVRRAIAGHLQPTGAPSVISRYFGVMRGPADLSVNRDHRRAWTKRRR